MSIPNTATRLDHAVTITVNGKIIGLIQSWSPTQSRTATPIYELNAASPGTIIEHAPGNMAGQTIGVDRYDLYDKRMEQVWGTNYDINLLADQATSLTILESWTNPDGTTLVNIYEGCWFTQLGRTHSATGDRITKVSASMVYTTKKKG